MTDHDRLFKELLRTFFVEFVELFLPEIASRMERDGVVFLDKEIFTDIDSGERHEVDLLAKVRFRGQGEAFFLIHVENQAAPRPGFARRMFQYFARLDAKFALPVFPVAMFSYEQPLRPEPHEYSVVFPFKSVLHFDFEVIQLNQLNWRDYLRNPNPVANALMTRMRIEPGDRPRVKLECLRMLATLKLDMARSALIGAFMKNYLKLTAAETVVYNEQMKAVEPQAREVMMRWTTEWEEEGLAKGLAKGLAQGRQQVILRQLRKQLSNLPTELIDRVQSLSESQLDELAEALLDFADLSDAQKWFTAHT